VLRNPLEVEVDGRPEDVGDPRAVILLRLEKPLGIFYQHQCAERGAIYHVCAFQLPREIRMKNRGHTSSGGANAEVVGVRDLGNVDIE
jgi:hypothetical protein